MENLQQIIMTIWEFVQQWYWIPILLLYISTAVTILIENRNPSKTIAWILVIIFLPIIGLIVYFFFGQKFNKHKMFERLDDLQRNKIESKWAEFKQHSDTYADQIENKIGDFSKVLTYLNNAKASPTYLNNQIELYLNGEEKFPAFLDALRSAKHHIHLEYYIFEPDQIGLEFIEILREKSNQGVEVRVMADNFGSPKLTRKFRQYFKDSKVQFEVFLPVHFQSLANSNYRNHRKILIVDAQIAFVGGINISDKYINKLPYSQNNQVFWRDTSISIQGHAIDLLQLYFWLNWITTQGEMYDVGHPKFLFQPTTQDIVGHESIVSFAYSIPAGDIPNAMEAMILGISMARKRIDICTPYFIPSDEFKSALMIAVSSGVEVNLMLPKQSDSLVVHQASLSFLKPLMKRGVNVYLYEKGFLHAKTMVIDDTLAYVGTVNLDNRSFFINFELTSVFHDQKVIDRLNQQFEIDKKDSELFTYEKWANKSLIHRAFASICLLLAPIL